MNQQRLPRLSKYNRRIRRKLNDSFPADFLLPMKVRALVALRVSCKTTDVNHASTLFLKQGSTNANEGGAFFDRNLVILAHSHT